MQPGDLVIVWFIDEKYWPRARTANRDYLQRMGKVGPNGIPVATYGESVPWGSLALVLYESTFEFGFTKVNVVLCEGRVGWVEDRHLELIE